ncbi:MAG: hypothetical protein V7752_19350 [Halopseudomonas sp.]
MTTLKLIDPVVEPQPALVPPAPRHLIHANGCPVYVWWVLGKRRNRTGQRWKCWFVYLEYRCADGSSEYVQMKLPLACSDDAEVWQQLSQVDLPGACVMASRARLIRG